MIPTTRILLLGSILCLPVISAAEPPAPVAKQSQSTNEQALRRAIADDNLPEVQRLAEYASTLCPRSERHRQKYTDAQKRAAMMQYAAAHNAVHTIAWLLEQKTNPDDTRWNAYNHHANNWRTSLHTAALRAQVEAVRVLLSAGANPNAIDSDGNTPLMLAATGNTEDLDREWLVTDLLLRAGADPARRNREGLSVVEMSQNEKVRTLFSATEQQGSDVNSPNEYGETPLLRAVRRGDAELVRRLLRQGAIVPTDDAALYPMLYGAVLSGNPDLLFLLPYREPAVDSPWESPLVVALRGNCGPAMTAALIQLGANADARSHYKYHHTPLQYARQAGDTASAAILLPHMTSDWSAMDNILKGDDSAGLRAMLESRCFFAIDRRITGGHTPLQVAERAGQQEIAELLRAAGADTQALSVPIGQQAAPRIEDFEAFAERVQQAVERGDVAFFLSLPQEDVNRYAGPVYCRASEFDPGPAKGRYYLAPALKHAAAAGKADLVRALLARGADLEVADIHGRTAIEYAAANGHAECVRLLLNAGAAEYRSALYAAALCGQHAVVDYLLARGVLPGLAPEWALLSENPHPGLLALRKPDADMALTLAVQLDYPLAVKRAVAMGANVNRPNFYPLHDTFVPAMVRVLVECGADLDRRNAEGLTPLEHARKQNYTLAAEELKKLTQATQK
ncbi:MAG: ankyrin repeat domain-containing protein [Akkermansia sp.]|nr:ankyrin repeat domain-containing protein [Akkermansia sp.]